MEQDAAVLGVLVVVLVAITLALVRSARRQAVADARLAASETKFRSLAASSPIGVAHLDATGTMQYANERLLEIFGAPPSTDPVGFDWKSFFAPADVARVGLAMASGDKNGVDLPYRRGDDPRWVRVRVAELADGAGYVATVADNTEQVRMREQLRRDASHDSLTGLRNRASFLQALELASSGADAGSCAVVFVDLDRFKTVNDTFGHAAGDELLVQAAARIVTAVGDDDVVARFGGDEFAVLLGGTHPLAAVTAVERIESALCRPFDLQSGNAQVGVSLGLVLLTERGAQPEAILRDADMAMYRAKSRGGGYEVCRPQRPETSLSGR